MVSFKYQWWQNSKFIQPSNIDNLKNNQAKNKIEEIIKDFTKNSGIKIPKCYWIISLLVFILGIIICVINIWIVEYTLYLVFLSLFLYLMPIFIPCFYNQCRWTNINKAEEYFEKNKERYKSELLPFNLEICFNLRVQSSTRKVQTNTRYRDKTSNAGYWISGNIEFRTIGEEANQNGDGVGDVLANPPLQPKNKNNNDDNPENNNNQIKKPLDSLDQQNKKFNMFPAINNKNFVKNEQNDESVKDNAFFAGNNEFARFPQSFNPNNENNSKFNIEYPLPADDYNSSSKPEIENKFLENSKPYQPKIAEPYDYDIDLKIE